MSDDLMSIAAVCGLLVMVGGAIGLLDNKNFSPRWLLVAAGLYFLNDAALTNLYGLIPNLTGGDWNWTGKILALLVTLAIARLPAFGFAASGITLKQKAGSLAPALIVCAITATLFLYLALLGDDVGADAETTAFQLTMRGLEEEPFYRGILLLALGEAYRGRVRALGVKWGWGALMSCALFGMAHAFGYEDGGFSFDLLTFLYTGVPALILVWLRERTGSLLLPVLLHNFGNSIGLFV